MPETQKPKLGFCLLAGALAGFINGFFGAGGGMVLVPLLLWLVRLEDKAAFSSAVAVILPLCAVSIAVYAARQSAAPGRPALSDRRRSGRRAGRALVPEDPGEGAASDPRRRDFGGRSAADRMLRFLGAILAGLVCGVLSGFGIGGGSLLMVWMTAVLSMEQKAAQGVNLLYFLPCAACALIFHIKNRQIIWPAVWPAAAAGAVCAVGGALLAQQADAETLRKLFGGFLILVGLSEVFLKGLKKK